MDAASEKRAFWKLTAHALGLVALALVFGRIYFIKVEQYAQHGSRYARMRLIEAIDYLDHWSDHLPASAKTIAFFGASDIEVAIQTPLLEAQFQAQGKPVTTLNLGVRNLDPELLRLFVRRISESLQSQHKQFDLAVVKFSPLRTTRAYAIRVTETKEFKHFEDMEAAIYSNSMLIQDFSSQSEKVADVFMTKNILGGVSSISAAFYTSNLLFSDLPWDVGRDPVFSVASRLFSKVWSSRDFNFEPAWNAETRGAFYFGYPKTKDLIDSTFLAFKSPDVIRWIQRNFVSNSGADTLIFDEGLLQDFIQSVREIRKLGKQVVVIYYPDFRAATPTPQALENLNAALARIGREAQVPVLDYSQAKEFEDSDYFDGAHLAPSGQEKLARLLAKDLSPLLPDSAKTPSRSLGELHGQ